jgi:hypothetical protein
MSESYEVGTRAWQPDPDQGWVPSEVERKLVDGDKIRLVFRLDNGEVSLLLPTVAVLSLPRRRPSTAFSPFWSSDFSHLPSLPFWEFPAALPAAAVAMASHTWLQSSLLLLLVSSILTDRPDQDRRHDHRLPPRRSMDIEAASADEPSHARGQR